MVRKINKIVHLSDTEEEVLSDEEVEVEVEEEEPRPPTPVAKVKKPRKKRVKKSVDPMTASVVLPTELPVETAEPVAKPVKKPRKSRAKNLMVDGSTKGGTKKPKVKRAPSEYNKFVASSMKLDKIKKLPCKARFAAISAEWKVSKAKKRVAKK